MADSPGQITLRPLDKADLPMLLAWRNDPEVMEFLPSSPPPVSWEHLATWFKRYHSLLSGQLRVDWMIDLAHDPVIPAHPVTTGTNVHPVGMGTILHFRHPGGFHKRPVGTIHYVRYTSEIGLLIGEKTLWGQGIGKLALAQAMRLVDTEDYQRQRDEFGPIWAVIHPENERSIRLFESLNFVAAGEGRNGQVKYVWQGWKA